MKQKTFRGAWWTEEKEREIIDFLSGVDWFDAPDYHNCNTARGFLDWIPMQDMKITVKIVTVKGFGSYVAAKAILI